MHKSVQNLYKFISYRMMSDSIAKREKSFCKAEKWLCRNLLKAAKKHLLIKVSGVRVSGGSPRRGKFRDFKALACEGFFMLHFRSFSPRDPLRWARAGPPFYLHLFCMNDTRRNKAGFVPFFFLRKLHPRACSFRLLNASHLERQASFSPHDPPRRPRALSLPLCSDSPCGLVRVPRFRRMHD